MTTATLILLSDAIRERAAKWVSRAPPGTRITFKKPTRTLPQNAKMWAMLTDISGQMKLAGQQFTPDEWKVIFMHGAGHEVKFLPALDGRTFVPYGQSSSELDVEQMGNVIDMMSAWGAENGIKFTHKSPEAERVMDELRQRRPRVRDEKHLKFIREQPCCLCNDNTSVEAAHIRAGSIEHNKPATGMAEKPDDRWTLPLCGTHHREQHTMNEMEFWAEYGIDPFALAKTYHHQQKEAA